MVYEARDVSIVICAYTEERWSDLLAAVASIQQQSIPPHEIIVVIDHNPCLLARAQEYFSDVIVTESSKARGLSGARNHGIAMAKGDLVAFLDDDAVAEPDWLLHLSNHCKDPNVLGAGGVVEPDWLCGQPYWFPEEFYWVVGCSYSGLPKTLSVVRNPYGGCTCFRREVFETVGGFREGIGRVGSNPMGGEETELCIRAKQHWPHKVFLYDPKARIHHRIPSHRASWRYFRLRCYAEGKSKAIISRYVGANESLASERTYIYRTLLLGLLGSMRDVFVHLDLTGLLRALAIVVGFLITTSGYLVSVVLQNSMNRKSVNASTGVNRSFHTITVTKR